MNNELPTNNIIELKTFISTIIREHISSESYGWLQERIIAINTQNEPLQLQLCFAAISRKIEKKTVQIHPEQEKILSDLIPKFFIKGWTLHRLCRTLVLLNVNRENKEQYCSTIESLFVNAEMNERADLFAALPILAFPEHWIKICVEGIRSNMGVVQEAIMYNNPFVAKYLEEAPWNQLVLKAFFTEKNINLIIGIDQRANAPLAATLIDYAMERQAAKRSVNIQLWRLVAKFINDANFTIIKNLLNSKEETTRLAAVLACSESDYIPAKLLFNSLPEIKNKIIDNTLNWTNIGT